MQASKLFNLFFVALLCAGCSAQAPDKYVKKGFIKSTRQIPPSPVYNRVTMARPPEVMPPRDLEYVGAPKVLPIIHLELKGVTLETVAQTLGVSARYRSYTAASIANKKFTIDALGTIDELADIIGNKADIYVSVDHANSEVRFLPKGSTTPKLYAGEVSSKVNEDVDQSRH